MVVLSHIKASNERIPSTLDKGLVAVFVGGTNGIGEATMMQFIKYAVEPRVYFTGRSQEAGDRIKEQCKVVNPKGDYTFIKADTSLVRNVDNVCQSIKEKEITINILCISMGTLAFGTKTSEELHYAFALAYYGRVRFILNLLPLLQSAKGLRRVVNVFTGTKEGVVDEEDFQRLNKSAFKGRGHASSMTTLTLEEVAKEAPTVSFVHSYPGAVKTKIMSEPTGIQWTLIRGILAVIGPFIYIPIEESGERHVYLATSAMYSEASTTSNISSKEVASSIPLLEESNIAIGSNGIPGSGVYTVDEKCESGNQSVIDLLADLRKSGVTEKIMAHTYAEFERITGNKVMV
jgi:NAD(P)-dependent dehydrogenase (short-subunit alcohol dehydrogenase family)